MQRLKLSHAYAHVLWAGLVSELPGGRPKAAELHEAGAGQKPSPGIVHLDVGHTHTHQYGIVNPVPSKNSAEAPKPIIYPRFEIEAPRALSPKPSPHKTQIAKFDSFRWVVRPEGDMFVGEIYPGGSALDGPNPELMRCGWSFVVTCLTTGKAIAFALGVRPPWITDI